MPIYGDWRGLERAFLLVLSIGSAVTMLVARLPFAVPYPVRLLVTIAIEVTS